MKLRIFLDLDGVLADFHLAYLRLIGRENWMVPGNWPTPGMELTDCLNVPFNTVYDLTDPGFFENLPLTNFFRPMLELVKEYDPKFHICSSPGDEQHPYIVTEKIAWVRTYISPTFDRFLLTHDKTVARGPGHVLIDDMDLWCQQFRMSPAPPLEIPSVVPNWLVWNAIEFPRPWNCNHALSNNPIRYVRDKLEHWSSL